MSKLSRSDLWSLEQYAEQRPAFRQRVINHKKNRQVVIGEHARLCFEDEMTIRYQVQEMLRIEKIFEAEGIQEELDAYNPLIPDGDNLKATFLLEYENVEERKAMLAKLIGIEDKVWIQVGDLEKVHAIADEDLERENDVKTSSVHFLRFQFSTGQIQAWRNGAAVTVGLDTTLISPGQVTLTSATRESLLADFTALH